VAYGTAVMLAALPTMTGLLRGLPAPPAVETRDVEELPERPGL